MFLMPDEDVAKEMGVRVQTIENWRERADVRAELQRLHREYKAAASRLASRRACDAAIKLGELLERGDQKVMLDTLKASGAFDYEDATDTGAELEAIIEAAAKAG